jgi:F-type H+-transporting ATPase subunit b
MAEQPHAETTATVEHNGGAAADHSAPAAFGLITAPMFIALAMIVVILFMVAKKVPAAIGKALDSKIDVIRNQLAEAEALRKDAEALKAEYEAKTKSADKEAATIVERARHEAEAIVAQAKTNAEALVERRQRMAEDKIAAEERHAIDQLRATAADAARAAAAKLIRERLDAKADEALVRDAIRSIGTR